MYAKNLPFSYQSIKNVGPESLTVFFLLQLWSHTFNVQCKSKTF